MSDLIQGKNIKVQAWIKFNDQKLISTLNRNRYSTLEDQIQRQQQQQSHQKRQTNLNFISSLFQNPVNSPNKLVMHSFVKFKSFSFNFSKIYRPKHQIIQMSQQLSNSMYENLYIKNLPNFCGIGIGGYQSGINTIIQGDTSSQGLFYSSVIKLIQKVKKNKQKNKSQEQIVIQMNFVSVLENGVVDLLNLNKKVILANDISSTQKFDYYLLKPLVFEGATNYQFITPYDFYTTLKKIFHVKKQIKDWGILAIQILISQSQNLDNIKNILLVQWQKSPKNQLLYSKMFQSQKPLLCLNQSILELYKFKQKRRNNSIQQQKQKQVVYKRSEITDLKNIQSFRNSAITRILKPYLLFDSKIIVIGSCSLNQNLQSDSYQTLMFCKHISKVASFAKLRQLKIREASLENNWKKNIQFTPIKVRLKSQQKDQIKNEVIQLPHNNQPILKIQNPLFLQQKKLGSSRNDQKYGNKLAKKYEIRSQTPNFSEVKDPLLIKQKMQKMLTQINEKSITDQQELAQMLKKEYEQKKQLLLIKKQKFIIEAKQKNAKLIHMVNSSLPYINKKTSNTAHQQEINRLEFEQLKRLTQKQTHIENKVKNITKLISNKLSQISPKSDQTEIKSAYIKNRQTMQNIKILRNQLKMELQLIQQETNIFLEGKQKIKKVYQTQLLNIRESQNQIMKKITRKTQPVLEMQQERGKQHYSLQISRQKNSRIKYRPLRLIKEMEPYFASQKHNSGRKYIKNQNNTISHDTPKPKKLKQLQESIQNQEDGRQIKLSRSLIKRKEALKQKIRKGRVEVNSFLDQVVDKYKKYGEQTTKKVKTIQQNK